MTARRDQPQPIVLDALFVGPRRGIQNADLRTIPHSVEGIKPGATSNAVDGLEPAGGDEPGARVGRKSVTRPLLERRPERILERVLGDVEVAKQADQRCEDAP